MASRADPGLPHVPGSFSAAASLTPTGKGLEVGSVFAVIVAPCSASRPVDRHLLKECCLGFSWGSVCRAGCRWATWSIPLPDPCLDPPPPAGCPPEHLALCWLGVNLECSSETSKQAALGGEPAVLGAPRDGSGPSGPKCGGLGLGHLVPPSALCQRQHCLDAQVCWMGLCLCFSKQGCPAFMENQIFQGVLMPIPKGFTIRFPNNF